MPALSKFKGNPEAENKGVWVDFGEGISFLIAKMNNTAYMAEVRRLLRERRVQFRHDRVSDEDSEAITIKAAAKCILLGWKNILDDDGKEIPYSAAKAYEILSDPHYRKIYVFIIDAATEERTFAVQAAEDSLGN